MIEKLLKDLLEVSLADRVILQKVVKDHTKDFAHSQNRGYRVENVFHVDGENATDYSEWEKYELNLYKFSEEVYRLIETGEFHATYKDTFENSILRKMFEDMNLNKIDTYVIEEDYFLSFYYYGDNNSNSVKEYLQPYLNEFRHLR